LNTHVSEKGALYAFSTNLAQSHRIFDKRKVKARHTAKATRVQRSMGTAKLGLSNQFLTVVEQQILAVALIWSLRAALS
jgi:hypothetical protein